MGLRKLIICDCAASIKAWEESANKLRAALPSSIQETFTRCEKEGKIESAEYQEATNEFNKRHQCRLDPLPKELAGPIQAWMEDPTVEMTMFGPSDFDVSGSLKNWSIEEDFEEADSGGGTRRDFVDEWVL